MNEAVHFEVRFENLDTHEKWLVSEEKLHRAMMRATTSKIGRFSVQVVQIDNSPEPVGGETIIYTKIVVNSPNQYEIAYRGKVIDHKSTLDDAIARLSELRHLIPADRIFDYVIVGVTA